MPQPINHHRPTAILHTRILEVEDWKWKQEHTRTAQDKTNAQTNNVFFVKVNLNVMEFWKWRTEVALD